MTPASKRRPVIFNASFSDPTRGVAARLTACSPNVARALGGSGRQDGGDGRKDGGSNGRYSKDEPILTPSSVRRDLFEELSSGSKGGT